MKSAKIIFSILSAAMLFTACENKIDFKKTSAGIPYKIFSSDKGDSVRKDYFVKYHVIQKTADSVLFSTYQRNFAEYTPVQESMGRILDYTDIRGNIMEILMKTKAGDSIYVVQSADSLIKKDSLNPMGFKKGGEIITTVRVVQVFKTEEEARAQYTKDSEPLMQEQLKQAAIKEKEALDAFKKDTVAQAQLAKDNKIIEAYLKSKNIQAQKTDWGVYIQIIDPGTGPKPAMGKYANTQYKGTNLSGQEFDSGIYPLQIGTGGAIKGFEEGIRQLAKGGRAIIFIPSILGYGSAGSPPKIKPNENLVFEIEVLDITDTPPQQGPQQPGGNSHEGHGHD